MGAYSDFDIMNKETGISENPLSAYVNIGKQEPIPGKETVLPQPVSDFELLPDDGEPTPFDKPETTAAPGAIPTPIPSPTPEAQEPPKTEGEIEEDNPAAEDEDAKRKAHEEAEAKRKAEWDAKQAEKKAAILAQLDKIAAMNNEELMAASMQRVSADTEKLTRRNMKECVSEYIQTRCLEDPEFARMVMHPGKSMIRCFQYINRKAREFIEQEMKDNDIRPLDTNGVYGSDVPDDLCYQWGEDYFRDPDAKEDHKDDEKFVPKPYIGSCRSSKPKSKTKKKAVTKAEQKPKETTAPAKDSGQMSMLEMAS